MYCGQEKQAGLQNLQEQAQIRRNYYPLQSIHYMKIIMLEVKICLRFTIKIFPTESYTMPNI